MRGKTFKVDLGFVDRLGKKTAKAVQFYNKNMEQRVTRATNLVWQVAHQRRPMISKGQAKAEGRRVRVSDPLAELGVPVRTGALQASIRQKVSAVRPMIYQGQVFTKGIKYAPYIEFGTYKMAARPFMRPAITVTMDSLKRLFGAKAEGKF